MLPSHLLCIQEMRQHILMSVLEQTYGKEEGCLRLCGEIQGNVDEPLSFAQQSTVLSRDHRELAPGLNLRSCARDREIVHNNALYLDDNNGHVSVTYREDNEYGYVIEGLTVSSEKWSNLIQVTGGVGRMC